ncbi:DUF4190 domain-containing protein [Streptomyces sp. NPDC060194]|uniref:DUF4190 domain-containing protein n=1 Tax=Streptomyces sp. NPDC060194 TaxID=3347069 RepID=UPI00364A9E66
MSDQPDYDDPWAPPERKHGRRDEGAGSFDVPSGPSGTGGAGASGGDGPIAPGARGGGGSGGLPGSEAPGLGGAEAGSTGAPGAMPDHAPEPGDAAGPAGPVEERVSLSKPADRAGGPGEVSPDWPAPPPPATPAPAPHWGAPGGHTGWGTPVPPGDGVPPPPMGPEGPSPAYGYPHTMPGHPGPPAPSPYGYGGYGYGWPGAHGPQPQNGFGIAALVLGIVSVVLFCVWGLGVVLGALALVFGILGRRRANRGQADNGGVALAGIILGAIGAVVSAVFLGFLFWAINEDAGGGDDYGDDTTYRTSVSEPLTR